MWWTGNGTSMISLIIPPGDQACVSSRLKDAQNFVTSQISRFPECLRCWQTSTEQPPTSSPGLTGWCSTTLYFFIAEFKNRRKWDASDLFVCFVRVLCTLDDFIAFRLSVLGAITSVQHRLKLYTKVQSSELWQCCVFVFENYSVFNFKPSDQVPPNGLVIYCGTIVTDEGKEKKVTMSSPLWWKFRGGFSAKICRMVAPVQQC